MVEHNVSANEQEVVQNSHRVSGVYVMTVEMDLHACDVVDAGGRFCHRDSSII